MSKIVRIAIAVGMVICFTACGDEPQTHETTPESIGVAESADTNSADTDTLLESSSASTPESTPESTPASETMSESASETAPATETTIDSATEEGVEVTTDASTEFGDFVFAP